jgi:hypothetical protein
MNNLIQSGTYNLIYMRLIVHAVVQLVEALSYKRVFDSRWCKWNFRFT